MLAASLGVHAATTPAPTPRPRLVITATSVPATPKPTVTPKPAATPKPTITPKPTTTPKPTAVPTAIPTVKPTVPPQPTPTLAPVSYRHGEMINLDGHFGSNNATQTFLGGAGGMIEATATGSSMANGNGWTFNNLGGPTTVQNDPQRGKVLFTPEDSTHYNAVRRFDPGFAIPEQRYIYKAHWVRNVLLLDGKPYTKSYQWKHERIVWRDSVVDGNCEFKIYNWANTGVITIVNRSATDQSTYWGGIAPDHNGDWALMETLIYTGTQGLQDGKVITRVHKNGHTYISQNRQAEKIYADPDLRLRYFIEQNYFGNFGQREDGVDNPLPKPDVRQVYSDDSRILISNDNQPAWKRVELRDSVDLHDATVRELQDWTVWSGGIQVKLNTGGLPKGRHRLYLVVIEGVDANGWDNVVGATPINVSVD
ncbi:hypothetical protein [Andreprevotia sp. IGB-42]|uniref:hypothetical protein n=1 Tax=Andreprevotia sp. IGB-42 TaxID=2497473 RepID=UPI00135C800F|nr:hypothetical protein [Andreprevotia sp. IGB-42]